MEDDYPGPRTLVVVGTLFEIALGLAAVLIGWPLGIWPHAMIQWTLSAAVWGSVAALPMMLLLLGCIRLPIWPFVDVARVVDEILTPMFRRCRLIDLALISASAGIGEELLFRGLIQQGITGWIGGPIGIGVGLAVASVLFGLVHPITKSYAVLATLMGLYLGWLWLITGNLLVPIMAHGVYDFLALIYLVRFRENGAQLG